MFECQDGIVGPHGHLPGLAAAALDGGVLTHIGTLADAARSAGVTVYYCTVEKRSDGFGNPFNTPLEMRMRAGSGADAGPPPMGDVVAEIAPRPGDVVVPREHGMTGFHDTGLDAYLRNTGVRTVVLTGVSLNIGIIGTAIEAVNRGYTVVVPTDCVAGDPPEFAEQTLRYSIRNIALLSTSSEVADTWRP